MKTKLIALLVFAFVAAPLMAAPTAVDFAPFSMINNLTARINAVMARNRT